MRATFLAVALVAVALAGCSDDKGSDPEPVNGRVLTATDDTGVIRCLVVDAAIRPVADAQVILRMPGGDTDEQATDAEGMCGFSELPPGTYFLDVTRLGYLPARQSVDVVAGVSAPPIVKVLLEADPLGLPFVEALKFDGFIECSIAARAPGVISGSLAACSVPNGRVPGMENVTNDRFLARHPVDAAQAPYIQSEMQWDSTQSAGGSFWALPGWWNPEDDSWEDLDDYRGGSPIIMRLNDTVTGGVAENGGFQVRVLTWPADLTGTQEEVLGLTIQQEFSIYTHAFHRFQPPADWTFLEQGPPQVPR